MIPRPPIGLVVLLSSIGVGAVLAAHQSNPEEALVAKARAIQQRIIALDTHVDVLGANYATPALDPGNVSSNPRLKCNLPKMESGGLHAVFLAVFVSQRGELAASGYDTAMRSAMNSFEAINRLLRMYPDRCSLARTPAEVEAIRKTGKRTIVIGVENGFPLGEDLANVRKFSDLGAQYITLVHSAHNQLADSANPKEPKHNGLSELGRQVVAEMNRQGVMVDVSHASSKVFWDVIKISKTPIIASHSGCSGINPNPRNLDDEQLRALAKNGGVIQIVALAEYLKASPPERTQAVQALRAEFGPGMRGQRGQELTAEQRAEAEKRQAVYQERMKEIDTKYPGATLKEFVDHIDHAVKVAGINHVGIGTDFDGGGGVPGFNDHADTLNVTVELVRRGYNEEQIRKIWGGNLLRVWREVERAAKK